MKKLILFIIILINLNSYSQTGVFDNVYVRNRLTLNDSILQYAKSGDTISTTDWTRDFFETVPITAGGNENEIQLNRSGVLDGSPNFTWNDTTLTIDDGYENIFIGYNSGNDFLFVDVGQNTCVGAYSGQSITNGGQNTLISQAGYSLTTGDYNVMLGLDAGANEITGSNNVFLGSLAGYNNINGNNNIFLGYQAGYNESGSNKLYIENSSIATPLIYGEFDNNKLRFNADSSTFVGHVKIDSNAYVSGSIISLSKVYASAYLPEDSATVTTATLGSTYYFVKGNFLNPIGRGTDFAGDTLYINRPNIDSILIEYRHTARITSSKSATIRVGFADNGFAISGTTKSSSFGAGSSQSITHFGTLWVKDNDAIKYVVESSVAANDVTFQEVSLIIEEKYTSENYNK